MVTTPEDSVSLERLFNPRGLAVIGASNNAQKPGGRLLQYCLRHGSSATLYPVNPTSPDVMGIPAYRSVADIPGAVDVACVAVPQERTQAVVDECVQKRVKFVVIYAAGFSERSRTDAQASLIESARRGGTRILGPNCQGVVSAIHRMVGSYHACLDLTPVRGHIGLVAQTGALGGFLCTALWERGLGLSHFASVGNEADLDVSDFVEFLARDPHTRVIGLFLEGVRDGYKFRRAANLAFQARKPIVVLKTGSSAKGREAALTHTGAITGSDRIYDGLFKQLRVVRASTLDDLVDTLVAFSCQPLPAGPRTAFVSPSGAACSLLSDAAESADLAVADLASASLEQMRAIIPSLAVAKNPLDIVSVYGNPNARTLIGDIIEIMARDRNVDMVIPGITVGGTAAKEIIEHSLESATRVARPLGVPVLYWWLVDRESFREQEAAFAANGVPLYAGPERAVRTASAMARYARWVGIEDAAGGHQ